MFETINRTALIVTIKQPVIDWVNKIFPDSPITDYFDDDEDKGDIFLLPQADYGEDTLDFVKRNYKEIFRYELWGWATDEKLWPKKITWKMFNEWFDYSIQSMVIDLVDEDIVKEDY